MFLESFRHLIEIEALKKENLRNHQQIAGENKRISDLDARRSKTLLDNDSLKVEEKNLRLTESQNQIEDLQARLTKLQSQLSLSVTEKEQLAFENQIRIIKKEIDQLELVYFEKLELSENLLTQCKENLEFMAGSLSTLEEIKKEVHEAVAREEVSIENRNKRIHSLLDLCHPSLKSLYLELDKKFRPKSLPVSFLIDKKCTACHMTVDSVLKHAVDEGRVMETCPYCSRLLIPETARI